MARSLQLLVLVALCCPTYSAWVQQGDMLEAALVVTSLEAPLVVLFEVAQPAPMVDIAPSQDPREAFVFAADHGENRKIDSVCQWWFCPWSTFEMHMSRSQNSFGDICPRLMPSHCTVWGVRL